MKGTVHSFLGPKKPLAKSAIPALMDLDYQGADWPMVASFSMIDHQTVGLIEMAL